MTLGLSVYQLQNLPAWLLLALPRIRVEALVCRFLDAVLGIEWWSFGRGLVVGFRLVRFVVRSFD